MMIVAKALYLLSQIPTLLIKNIRFDYKTDWWDGNWYTGKNYHWTLVIILDVIISTIIITYFVKEIENEDQNYFRENQKRV